MDEEQDIITLVDDNGDEQLFEVLFTFKSEEYGKSYIILYPAGSGEDEEVEMLAYIFDPEETQIAPEGGLTPIEDDAEWAMVEEHLNQFLDEQEN
ncbi:DUF1292 domain-containing protein [Weissella paramesenteroides]|uniref:DUF1292 domain-containing protein n=1 Tax=Weissella paramesenteroides TaxID=1249 RepID=UPI00123997E5|nr:DUF1292 domain-containing protein [Weissella paramesenteroides]KAA8439997.1 DUF1292 domain-containing protein [Weissella paramesenteroides]KAA8440560.1 DUF1292 domain-containing protein [Weissella paramesenteroides]KAA8443505.1 DUF1292 domain-containing protein [Weissella paramesenteroides]KAA8445358.1 DUF1292 domain-containing protein [Weissella paramesenteroides]KAA8448364.1 DUF1292 domain-containing protein [Weissella paramesenteroides]